MRDTFARTLFEVAKTRPDVFIVVADISPAGSMGPFRERFPQQFINVGVAEQSMIGLCAGLALRGATPFAYTIATFAIYRCFEFVRDDLCYQNLPVTVVGIGGGVTYSVLGGTHHSQEDVALMSALPNMSILAPCDPLETQAATWASAESAGPVTFAWVRPAEPNLTADAVDPFVFGKLRYLQRGSDTCVISYGPIMKMALEVAHGLEASGRSVSVVSAHTLTPLDRDGLAQIRPTTKRWSSSTSTRPTMGSPADEAAHPWISRRSPVCTPSRCRTNSSTSTAVMPTCSASMGSRRAAS